jgi:hypothetical protein
MAECMLASEGVWIILKFILIFEEVNCSFHGTVTLRAAPPVVTSLSSRPAAVVQVLSAMALQMCIVRMCLHLWSVNCTTHVSTQPTMAYRRGV